MEEPGWTGSEELEEQLILSRLKTASETRLRYFRHVQRRDSKYIRQRMLNVELPGREEDHRRDSWG